MGTIRRGILVLGVLALVSVLAPPVHGADWPRWRGPNGDGISTETDWNPQALARGPNILWTFNTGYSSSNVAIQGDNLYTIGGDLGWHDTVFCLNAETGKKKWAYTYECRYRPYGSQSTPTIDGDSVYTLSTEGLLHCINAKKGKVIWNKHLVNDYNIPRPRYGFASSPVVEKDLLIINGNLYGIALDKQTGSIKWTSPPFVFKKGESVETTGSEYATAVPYKANNGRNAAIFGADGLYSVDVETGKPIWNHCWPTGPHVADPIFSGTTVFLSTGDSVNAGCALFDISSGKPKVAWRNSVMCNHFCTCVLIDGYLYGCHGTARSWSVSLRCVELKSGRVMWEKDVGQPVGITAANNMLIILNNKGVLHIAEASAKSYNEIARSQVFEKVAVNQVQCWTSPVLCNGRMYCRRMSGDLVCIYMRK